jgi:tellurite resistance protein
LLQALLLLRMLGWIGEQAFAPSYWAFSFGVSALASGPLLMIKHGDNSVVQTIAPYIFVACNLAIGVMAIGTVALLLSGRLLPKPVPV